MMRFAWAPFVFAFAGSVALVVACGDDDPAGSTSSSGGSSSGNIGGGSSSSSSGASGNTSSGSSGVSLQAYASAICEKVAKCQPGAFAANWASKDECVSDVTASNAEGLGVLPGSKLSQEQVDACAAQIGSSTCAFGRSDLEACVLKGTLASGAPCYDGRQCQSGRCQRSSSSSECGTCAAFEKEGGACIDDGDCAFGLACFDGECTKLLAKGAECETDGLRCDAGLVCANGNCEDAVEVGGDCTTNGNECRAGLVCASNACADPPSKVAALGEKCDASTSCRKSSCRGAPGEEKCVAFAKTTESCGSELDGPADCDGDNNCFEGKCSENTYPACE